MNKSIWQPFIYALLIVVGIILGIWLKPNTEGGQFLFKSKNKIGQILSIINEAYVDTIDLDSLEDVAYLKRHRHFDGLVQTGQTYKPVAILLVGRCVLVGFVVLHHHGVGKRSRRHQTTSLQHLFTNA